MGLTLVSSPATQNVNILSGLNKIEYNFKREDISIVDSEAGSGGMTQFYIYPVDISTYLKVGDKVWVNYQTLNLSESVAATVLEVIPYYITVDIPFVEVATGGYMNYKRNYYVELQLCNKTFFEVNLLPFTIQSDGNGAGEIKIDVSVINDLNQQRSELLENRIASESRKEFVVKYREVYDDLVSNWNEDSTLLVAVYSTQTPELEKVLNNFDMPKIYLGYPQLVVVSHKEQDNVSTIEMTAYELDINGVQIASSGLGSLDAENNGFYTWLFRSNKTVNNNCDFIDFEYINTRAFDFVDIEFLAGNFITSD